MATDKRKSPQQGQQRGSRAVPNFFSRLLKTPEAKASRARALVAVQRPAAALWTPRDYASLARAGFERNVVVYRCVRLVSEAAAAAPLRVFESGRPQSDHPLKALLEKPNPEQSGVELLEQLHGFLQTAGNAWLEQVAVDGVPRELYALRPDRMKARLGPRGWPEGWDYTVGGRAVRFEAGSAGETAPVLHLKLFHPTNDHYGLSPLEAASASVDLHNAALAWNKALLDNAARPSGALVYQGPEGAENLSEEQFQRLKAELADLYAGAANAGRPMLLDGGLEWRPMSLTPAEMDFAGLKDGAAREIALAFGVPPMLLGIPGDNTYSNYREANLAFWRQTVLPLARKTAAALSAWLGPVFGARVEVDAAGVDALSAERDALWARVSAAGFMTDEEKRDALGVGAGAGA